MAALAVPGGFGTPEQEALQQGDFWPAHPSVAGMVGPRTCSKCGEPRGLADFAVDRSKASGRKSWCKACDRAKAARYYAKNWRRKQRSYVERERAKGRIVAPGAMIGRRDGGQGRGDQPGAVTVLSRPGARPTR